MGLVHRHVLGPSRQVCMISDQHHSLLNCVNNHLDGFALLVHRWRMRHFANNMWRWQKKEATQSKGWAWVNHDDYVHFKRPGELAIIPMSVFSPALNKLHFYSGAGFSTTNHITKIADTLNYDMYYPSRLGLG